MKKSIFSGSGQRANARRTLRIEPLESRRLLAVTLGGDSVLAIEGTDGEDTISVEVGEPAEAGGPAQLIVDVNGEQNSFDVDAVTSIEIDALGGKDRVRVSSHVLVDAVIDGGDDKDWLWGGGGNDTLHGGGDKDRLYGGGGNDTLYGDADKDKLWGDAGDDILHGGDDKDKLRGGEGNDELYGEAARDHLYGHAGDDLLDGGGDNDKIWSHEGDDVLLGGNGMDRLRGGAGNDFLDGGDDNRKDKINGGDGSDVISDDRRDKMVNGLIVELEIEFEATLNPVDGSTATGSAEFEVELEGSGREVEFCVEIEDAAPSTTYDVVVDGVVVGSITTDEEGCGEIELSSDPDEPDEATIPEGFPELEDGSTIAVTYQEGATILEGSFVAHHVEWQIEFAAILNAVNGSTATGSVEFEAEQEEGERELEFCVEIEGAAPSTTYDVIVGGVAVGSITTDAEGYGEIELSSDPDEPDVLPLPEDFPEVEVGVTISVNDSEGNPILEGSFA